MRVTKGETYRKAQGTSRGPVARDRKLDHVDRALIEALQLDGRRSFRRIARDVGVSEATIRSRYQRLCADNILQVTAVTNPLGVGYGAMAMVGIRTAGPPSPVAEQLAAWNEAGYVVVTAGQFDLVVELVCADSRHLLELTDRIRTLSNVVSTETFLYLELRKQLYDWGARVGAQTNGEERAS